MRSTGSREVIKEGGEQEKSQPNVFSAMYISGLIVVSLSGRMTTDCPLSTSSQLFYCVCLSTPSSSLEQGLLGFVVSFGQCSISLVCSSEG